MTIYDVVILSLLVIGALAMLTLAILECLIVVDFVNDLRSKRNDSSSNIIDSDDVGID